MAKTLLLAATLAGLIGVLNIQPAQAKAFEQVSGAQARSGIKAVATGSTVSTTATHRMAPAQQAVYYPGRLGNTKGTVQLADIDWRAWVQSVLTWFERIFGQIRSIWWGNRQCLAVSDRYYCYVNEWGVEIGRR